MSGRKSKLAAAVFIAAAGQVAIGVQAWAACTPHLTIQGATVLDPTHHLEWQRCAVGTAWNGHKCTGEPASLSQPDAALAAKQAGKQWRLPTAQDYDALLRSACGADGLGKAFPDRLPDNPEGDPYWTATPTGMGALWYFIDLADGQFDGHGPDFSLSVRLVRTTKP